LREGWTVGKERFYRVSTEEGLALRRNAGVGMRARCIGNSGGQQPRNDIWSMDFVADECTDGRRCRTLTILDLFTWECLDIAVGRGLTGHVSWPPSSGCASTAGCPRVSTATPVPNSAAPP
jgi:putative transposase